MSAEVTRDIEQAVRSLQRGADRETAAGQLFEHGFPPACRFFRRRGFAPEVARELTQRTLLQIHRDIGGFGFDASFDRWLLEVVANVWRGEPAPAATAAADADAEEPAADRAREVAAAVAALPGRMRQSVLLRFGQGLEPAEIASLLNIQPGTVTSQLHNAGRRLRPLLPDLPEEPDEEGVGGEAPRELIDGVRRAMTEARRQLREPPTPGELIGYVESVPAVPARRRIEDWIVADRGVARAVLDLRTFPDLPPPTEGEDPSETECAAAWEAMRETLRAEGLLPAAVPRRAPVVATAAEPAPGPIEPAAAPIGGDEPQEEDAPPVTAEWFEASAPVPAATTDWFEVSRPAPPAAGPAPEPTAPPPVAAGPGPERWQEAAAEPGAAAAEAEPDTRRPPPPAPNPAARWGSGHIERVRPAVPRWAPPLAAMLAVATLGLAAYLGWLYFTGQVGGPSGPPPPPPEAPRLNPIVRTLRTAEAAGEGGAPAPGPVVVPKASDALVLQLAPNAAAEYPAYRIEVYDAVGKRIFARDGLVRHPDGGFTLDFPRRVLVSGRYRIVVVGVGSAGQRPVAIYDLALTVE